MNAFILLIPIFFIRFVLLRLVNKEALKRAGFFPRVIGIETAAFWIYQITNVLMFLYLFFLHVDPSSTYFYAGLLVYILGVILYAQSIIDYAKPKENGMNLNGLYRISRNPMYVAYFIYFLGCAILTESVIFLAILLIFQASVHWLILSEERWCIKEFGADYQNYMHKVRRYF